jgi:DNA invertase Pin-like site-specific DNA recombinase
VKPFIIHDVIIEAAERAAEALEKEAREIRETAVRRARLCSKDLDAEYSEKAAVLVCELVEDGRTPEEAVNIAAAQFGVSSSIVEHHVKRNNRAAVALDRWQLERDVIAAASTLPNDEIADRYGISTSTVTRIIRKAYRTAAHEQTWIRRPLARPGTGSLKTLKPMTSEAAHD